MITLVAGCVAVTTTIVGLVTNAASSQHDWPGVLRPIQYHPWVSLAVAAGAIVVLTALLAFVSRPERQVVPESAGVAVRVDAIASVTPVTRTLPRDIAAFTDRVDELRRLIDTVAKSRETGVVLPVCTIDGMPGAGKTAFAVHAAHLLVHHFPDGQLFVDLTGHTAGRRPVDPADVLASLLAADGVPAQRIPIDTEHGTAVESRAAMWRTRLADRRMLLILDDAAGYHQVESLLPGGGGCLVLITSRKRLSGTEELTLQMNALSIADAVSLFVRLSGRDVSSMSHDAVRDLVNICGCLPLAVAVLAAQMRHHPSWSVDRLRSRLAEATSRVVQLRAGDRAVTAAFDLSYRNLPEDRRRFFRRLGIFPGTEIDAHTSAALNGVTIAAAESELAALYDDHLVDENAEGRYRLHDLVRDYVRVLANDDETMDHVAASERLAEYYLRVIASANHLIDRPVPAAPTPPDGGADPVLTTRADALNWLEQERANVLALVRQAESRGEYATVVRLISIMAPYLRHSGPWDQALELNLLGAEAAGRLGDRLAQAAALTEAGILYRLMASYQDATRALTLALDICREEGDRLSQARTQTQLGIVRYMMADYPSAEEAQSEVLAICEAAGHAPGVADALLELGMIRRRTSRYQAAAEAHTAALSAFRELGDRYGEANALHGLGIMHQLSGDYLAAAERHAEAFDIFKELGDRVHQAYTLNEIGVMSRLFGDPDRARAAHAEALECYVDLGDRFGQADSLRYLGIIHRVTGEFDEGIRLQRDALDLYRDLDSRGGEAVSTCELGELLRLTGNRRQAEEMLALALDLYRDLGDSRGEAEALTNQGRLRSDLEDVSGALECFGRALELSRRTRAPLEEAQALDEIGRCRLVLGEHAVAVEMLQQALAVYRRLGVSQATAVAVRLAEIMTTGPSEE